METPSPPLRVLILVSKRNSLWTQFWTDTEELLPQTISILETHQMLRNHGPPSTLPFRLLVKKRFHLLLCVVIDICNQDYDAATGHLPDQNTLPVVVVRYGGKDKISVYNSPLPLQNRVNYETGEIHNLTGKGSMPPFVIDHTSTVVPYYDNARDHSLLNYG